MITALRRVPADLAPLVPAPAVADLPPPRLRTVADYLGTSYLGPDGRSGQVSARDLRRRGTCRISLSADGVDVIRLAGSFRVPADAVRRASRSEAGFRLHWQHGDYLLDTGFRVTAPRGADPTVDPARWVRSLSKLAKENA